MKGKKFLSLSEGINIWNYISRLHPEAVKKIKSGLSLAQT
jgi:hypothetical protein